MLAKKYNLQNIYIQEHMCLIIYSFFVCVLCLVMNMHKARLGVYQILSFMFSRALALAVMNGTLSATVTSKPTPLIQT